MKVLITFFLFLGLNLSGQAQERPFFNNQRIIPLQKAIEHSQDGCVTSEIYYLPHEGQGNNTPVVPLQIILDEVDNSLSVLLPSEIATYVLSFLSGDENMRLRTVHTSWNTYFLNGLKEQCLVLNDTTIKTVPNLLLKDIGGFFFNLTIPNFPSMTSLLAQTKDLKYLGIRFNGINDKYFNIHDDQREESLKLFIDEVKKLTSLRYLDLYKTNLRIFNFNPHSWPFMGQLQLFHGGYNNITKKGATYKRFLQSMKGVQVLSLQGISCLNGQNLDVIKALPSLKFVNLNGTKVKGNFVNQLRYQKIQIYFEAHRVNGADFK